MNKSKTAPYGTIVLFLVWIAVLVLALVFWQFSEKSVPPELQGVLRPEPRALEPFTLVDQNNQPFNLQRFQDKWSFIFFGYTYCPDICPMTLTVLSSVMKELKDDSETKPSNTQIIFISVDPERDRPEVLARYVRFFYEDSLGVTGTKKEIDNLSKQFGAGYIKEPETAPGEYLVSHTSSIFLVDPQTRLVASFSPPHQPATIVELYQKIRSLY